MAMNTDQDDEGGSPAAEPAEAAPARAKRKPRAASTSAKPAPRPRSRAGTAAAAASTTSTAEVPIRTATAAIAQADTGGGEPLKGGGASPDAIDQASLGDPPKKKKKKHKTDHAASAAEGEREPGKDGKDHHGKDHHGKEHHGKDHHGKDHHGKASFTLDDLHKGQKNKLSKKAYESELKKLFLELIKLQEWVVESKARVVVIFEGRDTAGKGGVIKRISEPLNPRVCRVAALGTPSSREKTQWYFQRYVEHLPAGGEIVLFDRSWYNRAGVEHVMGFCTEDEYKEFLRSCPEFEYLLVRSGIILLKYWLSVSDAVQEERFHDRAENPLKRWKLSPMDLKSRDKWVEYSQAKDAMFMHTDTRHAPWFVVNSDVKERARLNLITHMLSRIPYQSAKVPKIKLGKRKKAPTNYVRPPLNTQNIVPEYF